MLLPLRLRRSVITKVSHRCDSPLHSSAIQIFPPRFLACLIVEKPLNTLPLVLVIILLAGFPPPTFDTLIFLSAIRLTDL